MKDRDARIRELKGYLTLKGFDVGSLGTREFQILPEVLFEDELPIGVLSGSLDGSLGLLLATDRRLMFVDKKFLSARVEDFRYDNVNAIQYELKMTSGVVTIVSSGISMKIENVMPKEQVHGFCSKVRERLETNPTNENEHRDTKVALDVVDALERLGHLREKGLITDDEFEIQKRRLLE